ncbi:hypothetical protein M378DRAFT_170998 [Amanita muscaria Koide BX008]|uniref:Uncharacterized protein n=1 Tax=Amanita muscaria (strain Koide BX008) TaxID=946122 RepID=A0A0C2WA60_AMAMK|nr:hypothetical protein M378DRAFT_170998 [Amanita muscaria Koide BX008]
MRGGFYLSLSQLYSCLRLSADKQSYDVPIPGDWATIAVVAEIGGVRYTRAPVSLAPDEDEKEEILDGGYHWFGRGVMPKSVIDICNEPWRVEDREERNLASSQNDRHVSISCSAEGAKGC